jgi:preprotein translocase subunit SecB
MSGNGANIDQNTMPALNALGQYTKDFSFENPYAPRSLAPSNEPPPINISVNVNAKKMSDTDYEVELVLEGGAGEGQNTLFKFELNYAGVFRVRNIPDDQVHPVILIECPRLLFPFARQLIAEAVRNGGFPPLYIDPIDFGSLYAQRMQAEQQGQKLS